MKTKHIYIDGMPLIDESMSGIGYVAYSSMCALMEIPEFRSSYKLHLIITKGSYKQLLRWGPLDQAINVVEIPLPKKVFNALFYYNLLPPMDVFLGKGTFLFFNFKNWRLFRSANITYIHDFVYKRYPETMRENLRFIMNRLMPKWVKRASKTVVVSHFVASEFEHFFPDNPKPEVVPNGVDHNTFYPVKSETIQSVLLTYHIAKPYFLFVGNIEPRKNLMRFLDAVDLLPVNIQQEHAVVLIGGKGWKNNAILKKIATLRSKGILFVSPDTYVSDKDLAALYSGAVALVHPAIYEGFGLTPLQAMACGCAVICGHNSALSEVVGDTGIICDVHEVISLRDALVFSIISKQQNNDDQKTKRMNTASLFSWHQSANRLLAVIKSVDTAFR